jgi:hypothetical protein
VSRNSFEVTEYLCNRFKRFVKIFPIEHPDICHLWMGGGRGGGYRAFKVGAHCVDSHVIAWRIANNCEHIPDGKIVMHTCDVKLCVRPSHLVLGTYSENMMDR